MNADKLLNAQSPFSALPIHFQPSSDSVRYHSRAEVFLLYYTLSAFLIKGSYIEHTLTPGSEAGHFAQQQVERKLGLWQISGSSLWESLEGGEEEEWGAAGHFCCDLLPMGWRVGRGCFLGVSDYLTHASFLTSSSRHACNIDLSTHASQCPKVCLPCLRSCS